MGWRRSVSVLLLTALAVPVTPASAFQAAAPATVAVTVEHRPVDCIVAERYPVLVASAAGGAAVTSARTYFRSALTTDFHSVEGRFEGGRYVFTLPAPRIEAERITYYVELLPHGRTPEHSARVVEDEEDCDEAAAPFGTVPGAVLGPAGIPAGFMGAAAAAGGISTALLIAGAAAIIGVTAAVVGTGDDAPASPSR